MGLWRELILLYHTELRIKTLVVFDCTLGKNTEIGRELSPDEIQTVMDNFVESGQVSGRIGVLEHAAKFSGENRNSWLRIYMIGL